MFWKKKPTAPEPVNYAVAYLEAAGRNSPEEAQKVLKAALANEASTAKDLGLLCWAIYERKAQFVFTDFVHHVAAIHPNSSYPAVAFSAALLAHAGDFDGAALQARHYLRVVRDLGLLRRERESQVITYGIAEAFMITANLYTTVGARSYSLRVLELAASPEIHLAPGQVAALQAEAGRVREELRDPEASRVDGLWEELFTAGFPSMKELFAICDEKKLPFFARRIDLVEGGIRFGQDRFRDFQEEFFLELCEVMGEDGAKKAQALV